MIEYDNVCKSFDGLKVLENVSCVIPDSRITVFVGPSGVGKSVLMKMIVGLERPDSGTVRVGGENVAALGERGLYRLRRRMGMLFQDGALFDSMTAGENVAFPMRRHTRMSEGEIRRGVAERLALVGMPGCEEKYPAELSGGMRKRVGLARAIALDPEIVLFDEPDSGLDPVRTALLCELIQEIHEENGGAYTVITHDIMSARRVAEYICVLWKGRIVEAGPAEELFDSDNAFVRQFLSGEAQGPLGME